MTPILYRSRMSLDGAQRMSSAIALALVIALGVVQYWSHGALARSVGGVVLGSVALAWALSPCALQVDLNELTVRRRAWPAYRVPRERVVAVSVLGAAPARAIRLFGVGGLFGHFGLFRNRALGNHLLFKTRGGRAVLVERRGQLPLVVTPDDVDGLVSALQPLPGERPGGTANG